jgi:pyruvate dehydrogenase E2 component (dihydrolipoamide acetyltransferase)
VAVELVMPRLSDTMEEGTVVSWLIGDGQIVAPGQEIAEIETDKSTVPWEAPEGGVLRILVPEGTTLRIGQPIGLIDDLTPLPGGHSPAPPPSPQRSPAWGPAGQVARAQGQFEDDEEDEGVTTEFAAVDMDSLGTPEQLAFDDDLDPPTQEHTAAVAAPAPPTPPQPPVAPQAPAPAESVAHNPWASMPGVTPGQSAVAAGVAATPQAPAEVVMPEAPVATPDQPARDEGRFTPEELMAPPTAPPSPPEQRPAPSAAAPRVQASPVARRLAEELGLDLAQIQGTGPEGRVVRADIETARAAGLARPPIPAGAVPVSASEFTPPEVDGPPAPIPAVDPSPEAEAAATAEPAAAVNGSPEPEPVAEPATAEAPAPDADHEHDGDPTVEIQLEPEPTAEAEPTAEEAAPAEEAVEPEPIVAEQPEAVADEPDAEAEPDAEEPTEPEPEPASTREQVTLPAAQPGGGKGEPSVVELSRQAQTVARRMAESKATIPHYAVEVEVDAAPILALRTELASTRPDLAPPSINDLVLRATALALRAHPRLNGAYRDGRVEEFPRVNIGIPVDVETGLPVPVIQDADRLSLGQLAERSAVLARKARAGELRPSDVASATFTVTNLGMLGIDAFTAVITPGQAGILTVGRIAERPVARDGEIVAGQVLRLTLLVDHRAVYGAPAARFLARIRELLERPTSLLA